MLILYTEIQEDKQQILLENCLTIFGKTYQEKLLRYRRWQDSQLSLLGKLLLKEGMKHYEKEIDLKKLCFTKYKKPYFEDVDIQFNISHSGELVVVIFSENQEGDIGIDIEKIHSLRPEDFKIQMTTYEREKVFNAIDVQKEFFNYWTQKEAVIKAHGNGLSIPLNSFEIKQNKTSIDAETFFVCETKLKEGYICHFASQQQINTENITIKEIDINRFITA